MQNIFYQRDINLVFDLKGSTRSRYVRLDNQDSVPIGVSSRSSNNVTMSTVATAAAAAAGGDPSTEAAMMPTASAGGNGGVGVLGVNMAGREGGVAGATVGPSVTVASSVTGWDDSASDAPTESSTWRVERTSTEGKTNPKPTPVRAEIRVSFSSRVFGVIVDAGWCLLKPCESLLRANRNLIGLTYCPAFVSIKSCFLCNTSLAFEGAAR